MSALLNLPEPSGPGLVISVTIGTLHVVTSVTVISPKGYDFYPLAIYVERTPLDNLPQPVQVDDLVTECRVALARMISDGKFS
jgi:hypothetical protein